jgi:hypothetical protein
MSNNEGNLKLLAVTYSRLTGWKFCMSYSQIFQNFGK